MPKGFRKKPANGYKMPEPFPLGTVLKDMQKTEWKLGPSIGKGGFGEIYSAMENGNTPNKSYPFVIKIEPHENGPLFVEMHFYMRCGKKEDIETFIRKYNLSTFGMPVYIGSGSYEMNNDQKYRFIVMEKFGTDIHKLLNEKKQFTVGTAFKLALQMIYVLEYIHNMGYVHADLKGANILMGCNEGNKYQAYLVDFGLATKFSTEKVFKPNPKKAHDGTIEFLSRDAHKGVPTRRGDLEILAYNLIQWLGGVLPWLNLINNPNEVQASKEANMKDVKKFLKKVLPDESPKELEQFLNIINNLEFNEEPNYQSIRNIFTSAIIKSGDKNDNKLIDLVNKSTALKRKSKSRSVSPKKQKVTTGTNGLVMAKTKKRVIKKNTTTKAEKTVKEPSEPELMTEAMKQVLAKKLEKENKDANIKKKKPISQKECKSQEENNDETSIEGFNEEMMEIYKRKIKKTENARPRRNVAPVNYVE